MRGPKTRAERSLFLSSPTQVSFRLPNLLFLPANFQGLLISLPPEIRPQRLRHIYLRIRHLPKEKIAQPHLPARSDEQIRIGHACSVKVFAETFSSSASFSPFAISSAIDLAARRISSLPL